ncbi:MAG: L-threonylcarbamoyladenylate synthase [Treponema sp.]|nr:L-threonylcarbamoyladenylate synthase [Treponema sp.]
MGIVAACEAEVIRAAAVIRAGGLVAFPTETVYGLGADAYNPDALARVFEAKGRPRFDPLIVHLAEAADLGTVADLSALEPEERRLATVLAERFWPGPLTLVLPKRAAVPDLATGGLPSVAVRVPANETARRLIALSSGAVAAPSANPFGRISPTRARHVLEGLGDRVDLILDGGPSSIGLESTVLDLRSLTVLRPGGITAEAIREVAGRVSLRPDAGERPPVSPGMLKSHYAPASPLTTYAYGEIDSAEVRPGQAILFFDGISRDGWLAGRKPEGKPCVAVLAPSGDSLQAASRLFQILHALDRLRPGLIHAQMAPERGLGLAINDRLTRASFKTGDGSA